ncbi:BrxE family protein [Thauera sp. JM12B12]|uniref:BrxE family protein n=1 Tax=Thauera sp. JM12B12 TaxID=3142262 RepID=UPI0031F3E8C3
MSTASHNIDFDRLLRLRLVVARYGEMDAARWWNTGDSARRTALLGRAGSVLMSRGFPRTHRFAQARLVFEVARARCAEVFDPPGCVTLWNLPPAIEDQFDARWARWLENRADWAGFFASIESAPNELLETIQALGLASENELEAVSKLRRSAEGRAVPLPGVHVVTDALITQLAAGFSRGEPGKLAVPYARMDD